MELWSGVLSNNAAKVRIVLAEKQASYEVIELPWTKADQWEPKPEKLWQVNPRGQVPVLVDGDLTLFDSTVINEYLDEKYSEPAMIPGDLAGRARCRLWEDQGDFYQASVGVLIADVFLAAADADLTPAAEKAMADLKSFYTQIETQLDGQEYLCGDYSVADVSVFMTVVFAVTLGIPIESDNLQTWFDRMMARPVIAAEFEAIMAAVAAL